MEGVEMMASVVIVGRCGADPVSKDTDYGGLCTVNVATTSTVKGEKVTTWWRVTGFAKTGEMLARSSKGLRLSVAGEASLRRYTTTKGEERQSLEVVAHRVSLIDWPEDESATQLDEDIPF